MKRTILASLLAIFAIAASAAAPANDNNSTNATATATATGTGGAGGAGGVGYGGAGGSAMQGQNQAQGQLQGQSQGQVLSNSNDIRNTNTNLNSNSNSNHNTNTNRNDNTNLNANTAVSGSKSSSVSGASTSSSTSGGNTQIQTDSGQMHYSGSYEVKNVPAVFSPTVYPTSPCMGSTSAGASGVGFGLSFGSSWTDDECGVRETARSFAGMGLKDDALAILCTSKYAASAPACKVKAEPAKVSYADRPLVTQVVSDPQKDPIVCARTGTRC